MRGSRAFRQLYREQIDPDGGAASAAGFFVATIGALVAHVGVSAFVAGTYAPDVLPAVPFREAGIVAAALGLATMLYGDVVRLPRSRTSEAVALLGLLCSVVGVARFVTVYPGGWLLPGDAALPVALYVVGTGLLTAAESVLPLVTTTQVSADVPVAEDDPAAVD